MTEPRKSEQNPTVAIRARIDERVDTILALIDSALTPETAR